MSVNSSKEIIPSFSLCTSEMIFLNWYGATSSPHSFITFPKSSHFIDLPFAYLSKFCFISCIRALENIDLSSEPLVSAIFELWRPFFSVSISRYKSSCDFLFLKKKSSIVTSSYVTILLIMSSFCRHNANMSAQANRLSLNLVRFFSMFSKWPVNRYLNWIQTFLEISSFKIILICKLISYILYLIS